MIEYAIEAKGLTKRFSELTAVDHLDLQIRKGELFSLLGPNGAGKTTTIKMLSTLMSPSEGRATLLGHDVVTDRDIVRKCSNVSPQETAVALHLSVKENLRLIGGVYGLSSEIIERRCTEYMEMMELDHRARTTAKNLSGGLMRRLSIAMALITDPEVLFLDEPTLGLDPEARRELWKLITSLKGDKTIILTTHYLEEADILSDRIAVMNKGKIVSCGTSEELKSRIKDKEELLIRGGPFPDAFISAIPQAVSEQENTLIIKGSSIDMTQMISLLHEYQVPVSFMNMKAPTLDDVYLRLVGKEASHEV